MPKASMALAPAVVQRSLMRRLGPRIRRWILAAPHWCRVVMDRDIEGFVSGLAPGSLDALEISGNRHAYRGFRSWRSLSYPEFDLCRPPTTMLAADLVFCEQVLEHVLEPSAAMDTLRELVRPGGHLIVNTPFLIRIHREPGDYWRFTADGLRRLLEKAGLEIVRMRTWGNLPCLVANRFFWFPYVPFLCPLANSEDLPLVVWAVARRPPSRD